MSQAPVFSGVLVKQGSGFLKRWQTRFFTLSGGGELRYFAREGDARPKGSIAIGGGLRDAAGDAKRPHRFDVVGADGRVLRLAARTAADKEAWCAQVVAAEAALGQADGARGSGGAEDSDDAEQAALREPARAAADWRAGKAAAVVVGQAQQLLLPLRGRVREIGHGATAGSWVPSWVYGFDDR